MPSNNFARKSMEKSRISLGLGGNSSSEKWSIGWHMVDFKRESLEGITLTGMKLKVDYNDTNNESNEYLEKSVPLRSRRSTNKICSTPIHSARCSKNFTLGLSPILPNTSLDDSVASSKSTVPEEIEGDNVDEEVENIIDRIRKTPGKSKSRISEYLSVPEAVDDGRKTPVKAKAPALEVDKNEIQKLVPEPLLLRTPKQGKSGIPVRKPQTPFKILREEKKNEKGEEEPVNEVGLEIERRVEKDSKLHDLLLLNGSFKNDSLRLEKSLSKSEHTLHGISTKSKSIKSIRTSLRKKKSLEVLLKSIGENLANQSKSSRHSKSKLEEESKQNDQGNMTETRNNNTTQNNKTTATRRRSRSIKENENQDNLLSPVLNRSGKGNRSRSRSNKSGTSTNKSTQKITEDDKEVKHIQEEADVKSPVLNKSGQRKPRLSLKNKSSENNETTEIDDEKEGVQKSPTLINKSGGKRTSKRNIKSTHNTQEIENEINVQNLKITQSIEQPKNDNESVKIIEEDKASKIIPEKEESIQIVNNPNPQTNYSISGKDKSLNDSEKKILDNSKQKDKSIIKTDDNNDCVDLQEVKKTKEQKQDELIVINNEKSPSKSSHVRVSSSPKIIQTHHEPVEQENEFKEFNEDDDRELENAHQSLFNVSGRRSYRRVETPIHFEVQSKENEKEQSKSARKSSHHRVEAQIPVDVSTQVPSKENTNIVGSNSSKSQVQTKENVENEQNKSGRKSSHNAKTQIPTVVPSKESSHPVETQIPVDVSTQVPSKENTYIVGSNSNKSHQVQTTENVENEQNKSGRKSSHKAETHIPVDVSTQVPSKENTYIAGSNSNKSHQEQTTENEQNKSGRKSSHQVETQIPVNVSTQVPSKENTYIAGSNSNKSHPVQTTENVEKEQNKSARKSSHKVETQIPVDISTQVPSNENTYIVGSTSNKSQVQTTTEENVENEQNKSGRKSSQQVETHIPVGVENKLNKSGRKSSDQVETQIPVDVSTQVPSKENSFRIVGSSSNKSSNQENLVEQNKSCFVVIEESVQINSQDFLPPSNQAIDNVFVEKIQQQNEGEGEKKLEIRTTRSSTARSKQLEKVSLQNELVNKSIQLTPQAIEQPLNTRKGRQEIEEEQQQTSAPSTNTNFNSNSNKKPGVILNKSPVIEQLIEKEETVPCRKSPAVLSNKAKNSNNKKTRRRYSRKFNKKRSSFNNKSALKAGDKYQLPGDSNSKHIVKPGDETEDESSCNEDREKTTDGVTHSPGPCRPKRNDFDDPEIHNKINFLLGLNLFDVSCNIGDNEEEKKSSAAVTMHKKTEVNKVVKEILQDFSSDSEDERSRYVLKSHTPTPTKGRRMSRRNLHRLFDSLVSKTLSSANNTFASPVLIPDSNEPSSSSSSAMVNKSRKRSSGRQSLNLRKSSSLSRKSLNQRKSKNKSLRKSEADNVNVNREASVREELDDVQNVPQIEVQENKNLRIVEEDLPPVVSQIVEEKIVVQGDTTNLPPVIDVDIREDVEFNFNENEEEVVNESISNRIDEQRTKQQSVEEEVKENIPPSQVVAVESYVEPNSLPPPPPHSAPSSSVSISTSNKPKRRGRPAGSKSKMTESILPQIYIPDETAEISDIRQPRKRKVGFYCNGVLIYQDKAIVEKMLNACSTNEPQQKKKRQSKKINSNTTAASSIHGESIALEKEEETTINDNKSINQKKKNNNNSNKRQSKMKLNIIKENENDEGSSSCSATADVAGSSGEKNNFNSCRVVLQKIDLNNQQIDQYENEKAKRKSVKSPKRSKRLKNDKEKGRKKQEVERQLSLIEENVEHIIESHTNENKINRLSIDNNDDNIGEEALTGFSENTETSSMQRNSIGGDNLMLTTTSDKSINKSIDIPGVGSNTVLSCGNGHISGICKLFPSAQFKKNRHKRHNMEFQLMSGKGVLDITGTSKTRMKINKSYVVQKGSSYSLINQSDKEDMVICYKKFSSNDTNDQTSL